MQTDMERGVQTYNLLCQALEENEWKYDKDDEKLAIDISFSSDDLPIKFRVAVDVKREIVSLFSLLPFKFKDDTRIDGSTAVNAINYKLADGSFDYDLGDGTVGFRMTTSYCESLLSTEVFKYMIDCAFWTVDRYNDKLLALNKGYITIKEFFERIAD